MPLTLEPKEDIERLRTEYGRREKSRIPSGRYTMYDAAHLFAVQNRQRAMVRLFKQAGVEQLRQAQILDIGCGRGGDLLSLLQYGAVSHHLYGTDLLYSRLKDGQIQSPYLSFTVSDAQNLPYMAGTFDFVLQNTVFTSILDEQIKENIAREMVRVVKPGGVIVWYDFWVNPVNKQTKGIHSEEIRQLFPNSKFYFQRITLAPPLTRLLIPFSWLLCQLLERVKLFNTHLLVTIKPN